MTVEMWYGPVVLLLLSLAGSKRLWGVLHDHAMWQCRGRAVVAAWVVVVGEATLSQSQVDLSQSLSAREADLHHASAGEGLRASGNIDTCCHARGRPPRPSSLAIAHAVGRRRGAGTLKYCIFKIL